MGWSESYYRDYLAQAGWEWRVRVKRFIEEAELFFEELGGEEATPHIPEDELRACLRLWEELRDRLNGHIGS